MLSLQRCYNWENCYLLAVDSNEQRELWPKCLLNYEIKLRKDIF